MNLQELQQHWNEFGKQDPMWAILTEPTKAGGNWDPSEFFARGEVEINHIFALLEAKGLTIETKRALDFGCGVGRLTQALCKRFDEAHGIDIAPSMIEAANRFNQYGSRCHYHLNSQDNLRLFSDHYFNFIYSVIVLQHMRPEYSLNYVKEFMRVLAPQGLAVFQMPSHLTVDTAPGEYSVAAGQEPIIQRSWWQRLLNKPHQLTATQESLQPKMEMYGVRRDMVEKTLKKAGGKVIETIQDTWSGPNWVSFTYIVTRA